MFNMSGWYKYMDHVRRVHLVPCSICTLAKLNFDRVMLKLLLELLTQERTAN